MLSYKPLLNLQLCGMQNSRMVLARECGTIIIGKLENTVVLKYAENVTTKIKTIIAQSFGATSVAFSKHKEKMWSLFYHYRANELISSWKAFILSLDLPTKFNDVWLIQVVARHMLEKLIVPVSSTAPVVKQQLTADEHNALRYCAGYVLSCLKKKYAANGFPHLVAWVERQSDAEACDVPSNSFLQFTKLWVEKVNRGGLFLVNDNFYCIFHSMEAILSEHLQGMAANHGIDKGKVVSLICDDTEVQFLWATLTFDLEEETSQNILLDVVKLWVTVRGFGFASRLVEQYKRISGATKRTKSLRKELKKQE